MESKYIKKLKTKHKERADRVTTPYLYSDVDETLIMWPKRPLKYHKGSVKVRFLGVTYYLTPHEVNLKTLKETKNRGWKIVVWSKGGDLWAKAVLKALKIDTLPDYILSKPPCIIDDLMDSNAYIGVNLWKK